VLTQEVHEFIVDALEQGAYAATACEAAGIGESTYYRWLARGEQAANDYADENEPKRDDYTNAKAHKAALTKWRKNAEQELPFVEFWEAVTRATARAELFAVRTLHSIVEDAQSVVVVGNGKDAHTELVPDYNVRLRATVEFLKRRFPTRWTDGKRLEHAGEVVARQGLDVSKMTEQELAALDAALLALPDES
jgi:transposase